MEQKMKLQEAKMQKMSIFNILFSSFPVPQNFTSVYYKSQM